MTAPFAPSGCEPGCSDRWLCVFDLFVAIANPETVHTGHQNTNLAWSAKSTACSESTAFFNSLFRGNTVLHAVSCLLGCLSQLSNDKNQPSTSYALSRHDCFNVLTNIDFFAFIPIRTHACV